MTLEVTEMPRCCSRRIQSEVAWRVALRPFTVPASWIAPPNNSSFSVSVVLPASGCEMMAKVRRRATSSLGWVIRGFYRQRELQNERILAPLHGLVVALASADLDEPQRLIQRNRREVAWPHLEEHVLHARLCRPLEQQAQHVAADAAAAHRCADAEVEHVSLAGAHGHDAVRHHAVVAFGHAAQVTDAQAVAEDALAP